MAWRVLAVGSALACLVGLAACEKSVDTPKSLHHGRFEGVGTFTPGRGWVAQDVSKPASAKAAQLSDDDAVVVVVDSDTGEVRACGDLSGHCVRLNPWQTAALSSSPTIMNGNWQGDKDTVVANDTGTNTASPTH